MTGAGITRSRPLGATATTGKHGFPVITSATGGEIRIATGASEAGFNPIDLLYASLAACMAMSVRSVISRMGLRDRFEDVTVDVSGEKSDDEPARIEKFILRFRVRGDFEDHVLHDIVTLAEEEICTVGNTIRGMPAFSTEIIRDQA